jgi:hypothetical protein
MVGGLLMAAKKWARVKRSGAHGLRRGAWYPVVNDKKPELVFVDVNRRNVPVPRDLVELAGDAPERWSVVMWKEEENGAVRASDSEYGKMYGVCPRCRARQKFSPPGVAEMACPECGGEFAVDWENPC